MHPEFVQLHVGHNIGITFCRNGTFWYSLMADSVGFIPGDSGNLEVLLKT